MDTVKRSINDSIAAKQAILEDSDFLARIEQIADVMVKALREGKRVLWCGNGGSAADAQHLAAELSGRFNYEFVCDLSKRIPRVFYENGRAVASLDFFGI